jgi:putative YhbY family RNA-binding protein
MAAMTTPLSSLERGALRADAHILHPVVTVSTKGLTASVLAEIDRALKSHELIKVKAASDDRELRAGWMKEICTRLDAHPIQSIGKVLVIYRERPPEPKKVPPPRPEKTARKAAGKGAAKERAPRRKPAAPASFTRTSRRRSRTP